MSIGKTNWNQTIKPFIKKPTGTKQLNHLLKTNWNHTIKPLLGISTSSKPYHLWENNVNPTITTVMRKPTGTLC